MTEFEKYAGGRNAEIRAGRIWTRMTTSEQDEARLAWSAALIRMAEKLEIEAAKRCAACDHVGHAALLEAIRIAQEMNP